MNDNSRVDPSWRRRLAIAALMSPYLVAMLPSFLLVSKMLPPMAADISKTQLAKDNIASGQPEYQALLRRMAAHAGTYERVLVLVFGEEEHLAFLRYRANYVLYPRATTYLHVPRRYAPPLARANINLRVPGYISDVVRSRGIKIAGLFVFDSMPRGIAYRIRWSTWGMLDLERIASPEERSPGKGNLLGVLFGLVLLLVGAYATWSLTLSSQAGFPVWSGISIAFLIVALGTMILMLLLSLVGIRWHLAYLVAAPAIVTGLAWLACRSKPPLGKPEASSLSRLDKAGLGIIVLLTVVSAIFSVSPLSAFSNWDTWINWGLKAKAFTMGAGIREFFGLEHIRDLDLCLNYPVFLPLMECYLGLFGGVFDEHLVRLVLWVFYLGLGLLTAELLEEAGVGKGRYLLGAIFMLTPNLLLRSVTGYADVPLACVMTASALITLRFIRRGGSFVLPGLLIGLATQMKLEGLVFAFVGLVASLGVLTTPTPS